MKMDLFEDNQEDDVVTESLRQVHTMPSNPNVTYEDFEGVKLFKAYGFPVASYHPSYNKISYLGECEDYSKYGDLGNRIIDRALNYIPELEENVRSGSMVQDIEFTLNDLEPYIMQGTDFFLLEDESEMYEVFFKETKPFLELFFNLYSLCKVMVHKRYEYERKRSRNHEPAIIAIHCTYTALYMGKVFESSDIDELGCKILPYALKYDNKLRAYMEGVSYTHKLVSWDSIINVSEHLDAQLKQEFAVELNRSASYYDLEIVAGEGNSVTNDQHGDSHEIKFHGEKLGTLTNYLREYFLHEEVVISTGTSDPEEQDYMIEHSEEGRLEMWGGWGLGPLCNLVKDIKDAARLLVRDNEHKIFSDMGDLFDIVPSEWINPRPTHTLYPKFTIKHKGTGNVLGHIKDSRQFGVPGWYAFYDITNTREIGVEAYNPTDAAMLLVKKVLADDGYKLHKPRKKFDFKVIN